MQLPRNALSFLRLFAAMTLILSLFSAGLNAMVPTPIDPVRFCSYCLATGYPYMCTAHISTQICLKSAGDTRCVGDKCTCCRMESAKGCRLCETHVDYIDDGINMHVGEDIDESIDLVKDDM